MAGTTRRGSTRRVVSILAATALVAGALMASATPAAGQGKGGADPNGHRKAHALPTGVANPGEVTFELAGGIIDINDGQAGFDLGGGDIETDPDADPATLTGTIDEFGTIFIPQSGVFFPTVQLEEAGFDLTINIGAANDVTGNLDPWTGAMQLDFTMGIVITGLPLATCTLNLPMVLTTTGEGGVAYARVGPNAGTVTGSDDEFAIPTPTPGGLLGGIVCPQLSEAFGLPAPAGTNLAAIQFTVDPVLDFKIFSPGHDVVTQAACEELGGTFSTSAGGVKSCTTDEFVLSESVSGILLHPDNTTGTNRWRATIRTITTELWASTDSQQGNVGAPGTGDTSEHDTELVDPEFDVVHEVATCQQTNLLGTWQNRALDSVRCVEIRDLFAAGEIG